MTNHNSPEEAFRRATQEDPIIMYLVVRKSLEMSIGKTAAQCAHASQMLTINYFTGYSPEYSVEKDPWMVLFEEWLKSSFRKVVLQADDKDWAKLKEHLGVLGLEYCIVVDAGLTEIAAGSETVIGICPMRKSEVPKIIKKLQTLK